MSCSRRRIVEEIRAFGLKMSEAPAPARQAQTHAPWSAYDVPRGAPAVYTLADLAEGERAEYYAAVSAPAGWDAIEAD